ncbi:MAG: imidazolonepropionase [Bdellovibrionota bacterium]
MSNARVRIKGLSGIFTGIGIAAKEGRHPRAEDCGYTRGPLDIVIDLKTGAIENIETSGSSKELAVDREVDGRGLVATPGFIDSHTHALFAGTRAREYFMRWSGHSYRDISAHGGGIHTTFAAMKETSDDALVQDLLARLRRMRDAGTLTVEIKSGYGETPEGELRSLRLIQRAKNDPNCPVKIRSTFLPLHALPKSLAEGVYVDAMIGLLPTIASEKLADHVDAFPEEGFFGLEQSLRFAREALKLGLRTKVHADELTSMACVENFVPLGALSVDHLQKISDRGIEALVTSKTVATFLPSTSFYLDLDYAPARRVVDAGARVALASDYNPGTSPEAGLQLTALLAASRMKLSAAEIFAGLTVNAAASLGLESTHGTLAPGMSADILLWDLLSVQKPSAIGQELLEEIFVESRRPLLSFVSGK